MSYDAAALDEVIGSLRAGEATTFILSGKALRAGPLADMGAIAGHTGARFHARGANGRIERGRGRVAIGRLPYVAEPAARMLAGTRRLVLVDAALPTTFFPYPGQRALVHPEGCAVTTLCPPGGDAAGALADLARFVGAPALPRIDEPPLPPMPVSSALTLDGLNAVAARHLPEGAIVCDEVITSGGFYALSAGAAPHDYLQLTGGAIGAGIPMALGAAVDAPERKVIALQADGSGLYTLQGLWTMAREGLDVTIVVFANRAYRILQNEMRKVGVDAISERAAAMLSLDNPAPSWVELAHGFGVEAARAESVDRFSDLWRQAMGKRGPFLIEAVV
jgi:acetolactate synthase-1/2/3 large subunit